MDHVHPRWRGGSNRVSNLVIACQACNEAKADQPIEAFLANRPELLAHIQLQMKTPLADAAAVNSTRWRLYEELKALGLPIEVGTGGRTRWNRTKLALPKTHWIDAACVATPVMGIHCSGLHSYSVGKALCSTSYSKVKRPARNTV